MGPPARHARRGIVSQAMTVPQSTLITPEALVHARDDTWAVVDCRYDLKDPEAGRAAYLAGHVPGAAYASLSHDLAGTPDGTNGRHPLPAPEVMRAAFGRLGIGPRTQVVAYDQDSGMFAARLWWMLRYMGHDAVAVLDGGFARWTREGREVAAGAVAPAPAVFTGEPRAGWTRTAGEVLAVLGHPDTRLVDARSADRFAGENETIDKAAGHIPGAVNHHFLANVGPDGTFLAPADLRARWATTLGTTPPAEVVCYCGSGVTACHNLLAMAHAGLDIAPLFVGSWSEWSSDPARPRETGPAR
jgi:thiosulfate/3-mercaptopyruvate sulfurtransferase